MVTVDKLIIGLLSMICMYNMFRELLLLSMTVSMGMLIFAGLGNLTIINKKRFGLTSIINISINLLT